MKTDSQADSVWQIAVFDKYDKFANIRTIFNEALYTVADVLPKTSRIEATRWTRPARTLAL